MSKADRRIIEELRAEADVYDSLVGRQGDILRKVANVLHGGELKDGYWSHHDLADLAAALIAERDRLKELLRQAHKAGIIGRDLNDEIAKAIE
jgi:hypothetical protein